MRVIALKTLRDFWSLPGNGDAEQALRAWYREALKGDWSGPADVKALFRNASFVGGNRVVFNVAGNKYRLVVKFNYPYRVAYVRFIGTHRAYDKINVETI